MKRSDAGAARIRDMVLFRLGASLAASLMQFCWEAARAGGPVEPFLRRRRVRVTSRARNALLMDLRCDFRADQADSDSCKSGGFPRALAWRWAQAQWRGAREFGSACGVPHGAPALIAAGCLTPTRLGLAWH